MSETARLTSKGQITIPKKVRERLGLEEGEDIVFTVNDDGTATLRPSKPPKETLDEVREELSSHDVDVDKLMRESKQAWSNL